MMLLSAAADPPQVDLPFAGDRDLVLQLLLGRGRRGSVMNPNSIPKVSMRIFAIRPTEFVVHEAIEMRLCCAGSYLSSFTPRTSVTSGSVAGAEMTTFFAPAVRC